MRQVWRLVSIVVAIVVGVTLFACTPKAEAPIEEELPPIKLGLLADYTGPVAEAGDPELWSTQLLLEEYGWEVAGRKIQLIDEDCAGDPTTSLEKARKLVEQDKVDMIMGPLEGHAQASVLPYLQPFKIPEFFQVASDSGSEELVNKLGISNAWWVDGSTHVHGFITAKYAYEQAGYRTASLIYVDVVYGQDTSEYFKKTFEDLGGTVLQMQAVPWTFDFGPYLMAMEKADVVVTTLYTGMNVPFTIQYLEAGLGMPIIVTCEGTMPEPILTEIGDPVLQLDIVGHELYTALYDYPLNNQFRQIYEKRHGVAPHPYGVTTYIGFKAYLEAVKLTGGDTTPEKINAALANLSIDTPHGMVKFSPGATQADSQLAVQDHFLCRIVKIGDRYLWKPFAKAQAYGTTTGECGSIEMLE